MKNPQRLTAFRSLFPSWRFFSEVVEVPILQYRIISARGEIGEWKATVQKRSISWRNVFFNPEGNIAMAENSLLEYFQGEIESGNKDIINSVSYSLVRELTKSSIATEQALVADSQFQFRIGLVYQGSSLNEMREIFISEPVQVLC